MGSHRRRPIQHRDERELSAEELAAQEAAELPERAAMSLLGGSLFGGGLPTEGSNLLGQAPASPDGAPASTPDLSGTPIPLKNPLVG